MFTDFRWWIHFIWQSGGDFLNADHTKVTLETPAAIEGLQYLHDLIFKYQVWPNPETLKDYNTVTGLFTSGRVGMYLDGMWQMPACKTIKRFEWGVAPLPHNTKIATGYYIDGWFVPKGAPHPDLSWELIASFLSPRTEDFVARTSDLGIPMLKSTARKDANILFNPLPVPEQRVWLDSPKYGYQFPWTPNFADINEVLARNIDLFSVGQSDAKLTVANITRQVQPLLDQLKGAH
jgi:multiple sugar transport system substrate-binding protein